MIKINADRKVIENLPPHIFSNLGLNQIAYMKTTSHEDMIIYSLYGADGQQISTFSDKEEAEDYLRTHELMPITVH